MQPLLSARSLQCGLRNPPAISACARGGWVPCSAAPVLCGARHLHCGLLSRQPVPLALRSAPRSPQGSLRPQRPSPMRTAISFSAPRTFSGTRACSAACAAILQLGCARGGSTPAACFAPLCPAACALGGPLPRRRSGRGARPPSSYRSGAERGNLVTRRCHHSSVRSGAYLV